MMKYIHSEDRFLEHVHSIALHNVAVDTFPGDSENAADGDDTEIDADSARTHGIEGHAGEGHSGGSNGSTLAGGSLLNAACIDRASPSFHIGQDINASGEGRVAGEGHDEADCANSNEDGNELRSGLYLGHEAKVEVEERDNPFSAFAFQE